MPQQRVGPAVWVGVGLVEHYNGQGVFLAATEFKPVNEINRFVIGRYYHDLINRVTASTRGPIEGERQFGLCFGVALQVGGKGLRREGL